MLECKNATWRQLLIQRNHKTTLGVCAGLSFTSSEQLYSSESPSSHQCVRILSCHLICSNYFFYLLQLFFICNNFFLFAAFSFNLQQLFYLQHVPCGPPYVMMSLPLIGTYFSVFFFYIRTGLRFALIGGNLTAQKYFSTNVPNISVWLGSGVKKSDIKSDVDVHHQRKHNVTWERKGLNLTTSGAKFPALTLRGWLHWYRTGFCATVWCSVNRCSYYTG